MTFRRQLAALLCAAFLGHSAAATADDFWMGAKVGTLGIGLEAAWRPIPWMDLRLGGNEFLFDVARDPRERANLKERESGTFERLKKDFAAWNQTMLPYSPENNSISQKSPVRAADRY